MLCMASIGAEMDMDMDMDMDLRTRRRAATTHGENDDGQTDRHVEPLKQPREGEGTE